MTMGNIKVVHNNNNDILLINNGKVKLILTK